MSHDFNACIIRNGLLGFQRKCSRNNQGIAINIITSKHSLEKACFNELYQFNFKRIEMCQIVKLPMSQNDKTVITFSLCLKVMEKYTLF